VEEKRKRQAACPLVGLSPPSTTLLQEKKSRGGGGSDKVYVLKIFSTFTTNPNFKRGGRGGGGGGKRGGDGRDAATFPFVRQGERGKRRGKNSKAFDMKEAIFVHDPRYGAREQGEEKKKGEKKSQAGRLHEYLKEKGKRGGRRVSQPYLLPILEAQRGAGEVSDLPRRDPLFSSPFDGFRGEWFFRYAGEGGGGKPTAYYPNNGRLYTEEKKRGENSLYKRPYIFRKLITLATADERKEGLFELDLQTYAERKKGRKKKERAAHPGSSQQGLTVGSLVNLSMGWEEKEGGKKKR